MTIQEEQQIVGKMMIIYGGNFACALGKALLLADEDNALIIKEAFHVLWEQFMLFHKRTKGR